MLLNRPITAIMLILATLIFGSIALGELSVSLLPEVDSPTILVRTTWSGAAPREVEQRINEPLEGVLSTVQGLESIRGFARQGQSLISLTFKWGHNMDLAFLNVREKLDQVRFMLPEQTGRPQLVHNSASDEPIAVLGITARGESNPGFETRLALKRWTEQVLARRLEQAEGIAQAVLVGAVTPEVQIRYRPESLNRYGVGLAEIQNLVQQSNLFTATGELRDGWYRYSIKIQSRIRSLDDVRSIPLRKLGSGKILVLNDVADIRMDAADPTSFALVDGQQVLSVLVKKEYGANTVEAYDTMLPLLDQLQAQNADVDITVLRENATFIRDTITNLLKTLLAGALLAFIVLFLFLDDYRTPLTIGVAIPASIFLTFFVMYLTDIQLNIISLSGLSLGAGMLVDNSIVALENINRHREMGRNIFDAARQGTREIALAMSASTFTNMCVFLPLVFIGGLEGAFFKDLAWSLSISLLASLLVALVILPVLVVHIQKKDRRGRLLGFSIYFNRLRDWYEQSLYPALRHRRLLLAGMMVLLFIGVYQFYTLPKNMLPESPPEQSEYKVRLPGNTSLNATRQAAVALTRFFTRNGQSHGIRVMGGYTDQTNLASLSEEGLNKFSITIPVAGYGQAEQVDRQIARFFEKRPGWSARPVAADHSLGMLPAANQPPVLFRLVGNDREQSERLAQELQEHLAPVGDGVSLQKQYREEVNTYQLRFKTDHLLQLGITEQQVIRYLEALTRGSWVSDWNRQDENIAIRLVGMDRTIYDPSAITLDIDGAKIPLSYLAEIRQTSEPAQLERVNQTPVLSYVADMDFGDWWWHSGNIREELVQFAKNTGVEVQAGGSVLAITGLLGEMGSLLLISVLIIYIILAIQFESLKDPLIIICDVPFAWLGSVAALWLTGFSLNALSFMGILILTGVCVNDSILKVDFMRRYYRETGDLDRAVHQAGLHRFRPIMMTALTTTLGIIPMLLPIGTGYVFRQSLALALMGGMITSTVLTLYLMPMIFHWVEGGKAVGSRQWR